jgi:hypothetical protein
MTDLEKILIRLLVNLVKDINNFEESLFKILGSDDPGDTKIIKILDKSTKPLLKYVDRKNDFTEQSLSDTLLKYLYDKNYTYKNVIELFEKIEREHND